MANLKDTIVLGNLTVTGKVVASDILVSGTGNEFDTIKVNKVDFQFDPSGNSLYIDNRNSHINIAGDVYVHDGSVYSSGENYLGSTNTPWGGTYTNFIHTDKIKSITGAAMFEWGSDFDDEDGDEENIHWGWKTLGDDETGCIFPETDNYGFIGTPNKKYYYGYINNMVTTTVTASTSLAAKRYKAGDKNYNGSTPVMSYGTAGQVLKSGGSTGNSYWSDNKIYVHNLKVTKSNSSYPFARFTIINNSSTAITTTARLSAALYNANLRSPSTACAASGCYYEGLVVWGIYCGKAPSDTSAPTIIYGSGSSYTFVQPYGITDTVVTVTI